MVCRLVFIVHQGNAVQAHPARRHDLRIRIMADGQIKAAFARPLSQRPGALHKIARLAGQVSTAMPANHHGRKSCGLGQGTVSAKARAVTSTSCPRAMNSGMRARKNGT